MAKIVNQEEIFNKIFEDNFKKIFLYCYNIIGNREESYDITQEVFIKANQEDKLYNKDFNVSSWLYKVSRNICYDYFRKIKRKFDFLKIYSVSSYYEIDFSTNDEYEEVFQYLQKIPAKYREILYLRFISELSYKEISDILQIPSGTVMSRISRGRELLKGVIKNGNK